MALDIELEKERHVGRIIAIFIAMIILAAAGWISYKWYTTGNLPISIPIAAANSSVNESDISAVDMDNYKVADKNPRYISIPNLHIERARVFSEGLDDNNVLIAPSNIHDVSWYEKSGLPGGGGVMFMTGHNEGVNKNGAFYKIDKLTSGDEIILERGDGMKFKYKVIENRSLALDNVDDKTMSIMGQPVETGMEGLNIITFDGKWVPRLGTFDRRILLRAVIYSPDGH